LEAEEIGRAGQLMFAKERIGVGREFDA